MVVWCGCGVFCAGGANRGTDTICGLADRRRGRPRLIEGQTRYLARVIGLLTDRTCPSAGRTVRARCGARMWGQTRCRAYRSGKFNVQRSTLNFQRGGRKGARWAEYGDRHGVWAPLALVLALPRAGCNMPARMGIMAISTSNSIRVNARGPECSTLQRASSHNGKPMYPKKETGKEHFPVSR